MTSETGVESGEAGPAREAADGGTPVANRIRERIRKARARFHANDNISGFIEEGARSTRCCGRW